MPRCCSSASHRRSRGGSLYAPSRSPPIWMAPPNSSSFLGQGGLARIGVGQNDGKSTPFPYIFGNCNTRHSALFLDCTHYVRYF